jgi:hypothetical protein
MNHYDSNYAANLERDDEEEPILCENCDDAEAWNPMVYGRQVCIGCAFSMLDEFIREQRDSLSPPSQGSIVEAQDAARKPAVGPIASVVLMWLKHSTRDLDDDSLVTIDGKRSIAAKLVRQAVAELEADR